MSANRAAIRFLSLTVVLAHALLGAVNAAEAQDIAAEDIDIATPEPWIEDAETASVLLPSFLVTAGLDHLGGKGGMAAFVEAGVGGLYVGWVKATKESPDAAKEARAVLDRLRAEPALSSADPANYQEVSYTEKAIGEAIEARIVWRHLANETMTTSRALVWLSPQKQLRVARAECVFAQEDNESVSPVCVKSLVSMVADDLEKKVALPLGPVEAPIVEAPASKPDDEAPASGPSIGAAPADPGSTLYVDPKAAKPQRSSRRRWIFVFGAILVAFALWGLVTVRKSGAGGEVAAKDKADKAADPEVDDDDDEQDDDGEPDDDEPDDDEPDDDENDTDNEPEPTASTTKGEEEE